MPPSRLPAPALAMCTALVGCFSSPGSTSSGAAFDAGLDSTGSFDSTADDTGSLETGPGDAVATDSTARDSATRDGGTMADATSADATSADATSADATAGDATSGDATSGDAATDAPVVWPDAGTGCNPPTGPSGLSATGEGLPSSGLVLWLRGDRGVYTAADDAGTVDASAGQAVCAWADQSGGGWVLQAPSLTSSLPTLVETGVGGEPAVWFYAGMILMTSGVLGIPATSARTFVAVETLVNAGGRFNPMMQGQLGSAGVYLAIDANTWLTAGQLEGVYMPNNSLDSNTATSAGSARVHVFTVSDMTVGATLASAIDYRVNGVTQTLTLRQGSGTVEDFSAANFTAVLGPGSSSTGIPASGMVAEALVYDRALAVTERATAEGVLKARYGIP